MGYAKLSKFMKSSRHYKHYESPKYIHWNATLSNFDRITSFSPKPPHEIIISLNVLRRVTLFIIYNPLEQVIINSMLKKTLKTNSFTEVQGFPKYPTTTK